MYNIKLYDVSSYVIPNNKDNALFEFNCDRYKYEEKRLFIIPKNVVCYEVRTVPITNNAGGIVEEYGRKIVFHLINGNTVEVIVRAELGDTLLKEIEGYLSQV